MRLRRELVAGRRIAGVIIPLQGRLSADPLHQLTFETECTYYGVEVTYGDAPGGKDWAGQTARLTQAQDNAPRVKSNRDNALGGNIARVLAGKAPAHRAPYGDTYRAEKSYVRHEKEGHGYLLLLPGTLQFWLKNPCTYSRFVPGAGDAEIWDGPCALLRDDAWLERQPAAELRQSHDVDRMIRLQ